MCKDLITTNLTFDVSTSNVNQAITSLRKYGLTEQETIDLLTKERMAITDYDIVTNQIISHELLELFGTQYTSDSLPYVYLIMKDFKIDWDLYKTALTSLIDVLRLEEIAAFPEKMKNFLTEIENRARILQRADFGEYCVADGDPAEPEYVYKVLENLKATDISIIISMCNDPHDEDCEEDEKDGKNESYE